MGAANSVQSEQIFIHDETNKSGLDPYYVIPKNTNLLYIHNIPVYFTWIGASNKWEKDTKIQSKLSISLSIKSKEAFQNSVKDKAIYLIQTTKPNTIIFVYNNVKQILEIEKSCAFHLKCSPCKDKLLFTNNIVGKVLGISTSIGYDQFVCGNRGPIPISGGTIYKQLYSKYVQNGSRRPANFTWCDCCMD